MAVGVAVGGPGVGVGGGVPVGGPGVGVGNGSGVAVTIMTTTVCTEGPLGAGCGTKIGLEPPGTRICGVGGGSVGSVTPGNASNRALASPQPKRLARVSKWGAVYGLVSRPGRLTGDKLTY